jgi:hypothetical protein
MEYGIMSLSNTENISGDWKEYFDLICNYMIMQAMVRVDAVTGYSNAHKWWEIRVKCKSLDTSEHSYYIDTVLLAYDLEDRDRILADIEIGELYLVRGQYSIDILKPEIIIFNIGDYQFPDYSEVPDWKELYDLICIDSVMWSVVMVESLADYIKGDPGWKITVKCRTFDAFGHFYNINLIFNAQTDDEAIRIMTDMKVGSIHLVKGRYIIDVKNSKISISHASYQHHNLIIEPIKKAFMSGSHELSQ